MMKPEDIAPCVVFCVQLPQGDRGGTARAPGKPQSSWTSLSQRRHISSASLALLVPSAASPAHASPHRLQGASCRTRRLMAAVLIVQSAPAAQWIACYPRFSPADVDRRLPRREIPGSYRWLEDVAPPRRRVGRGTGQGNLRLFGESRSRKDSQPTRSCGITNASACRKRKAALFLYSQLRPAKPGCFSSQTSSILSRAFSDRTLSPDVPCLTGSAMSDDGKLLAYSLSRSGADWQGST
jgi:hypothetical protein